MNNFGEFFWAKESHKYVWHAVQEGEIVSICQRPVLTPRMTQKQTPLDDDRCAKCDRLIWPEGKED
jgi:hypothetical protein